jgi:hypothetical protein
MTQALYAHMNNKKIKKRILFLFSMHLVVVFLLFKSWYHVAVSYYAMDQHGALRDTI